MEGERKVPRDKFVLLMDNRKETRIIRLCEIKGGFRWRKQQIPIKEITKLDYYEKVLFLNGEFNKMPESESEEEIEDVEDVVGDNRGIFTEENAQELEAQQIETLKAELPPQEIIQTIISHNKQFNQRTQFSKQKYLDRKQKKYLFSFHVEPISLRNIHLHYYLANPASILYLRWDILALILLYTQPHHTVLVLEKGKGILTAALLFKAAHSITTIGTHEVKSIPHQMNLPQSTLNILPSPEEIPPDVQFGSILIALEEAHLLSLQKIVKFAQLTGRIAIYSPIIQPLIECVEWMRNSIGWTDIHLQDTWMREYQVLKGRTHPLMSMHADPGYLLTAMVVKS